MVLRLLAGLTLLFQLTSPRNVSAQSRSIEGTYRNPALGYSISIPQGLKAVTEDRAGPERGVRISLPSGGEITVFGEPNSLEWKSPEEGVKSELAHSDCGSGNQEIKRGVVGKLKGARGKLVCSDHVVSLFLAFRKKGGPIYWLRLETVQAHESEDEAVLEAVAANLRLIPWK